MRLINSKAEILKPTGYTYDDICKNIEIAGRTCYKSEANITEDSAKKFVDRMIKSGHGAMLEHGTVYLDIFNSKAIEHYVMNKYSKIYSVVTEISPYTGDGVIHNYVTTNLRVLVENGWLDDLKYICEPTKYHEKRITVRFTLDRVTGESFLRHRVFSFARESTRYCNYSKDKFGNELTYIIPSWLDIPEGYYMWEDANPLVTAGMDIQVAGWDDCSNISYKSLDSKAIDVYNEYKSCGSKDFHLLDIFLEGLQKCEDMYLSLLDEGWQPQQARQVLPFCISSPLIMTGFVSDWKHFFDLRSLGKTGAPHPDAKKLADELLEQMRKEYTEEFENYGKDRNKE